ncbi:MAG TPA: glycoside hydrolase family 43 protein [Longimicrobiaceae bacterium]
MIPPTLERAAIVAVIFLSACGDSQPASDRASGADSAQAAEALSPEGYRYLSQPLVTEIYTADPSAHVFDGRIYVYGSHDIDGDTPADDMGSHFEMRDYQVLSMDSVGAPVTVHPVALDVDDVPWADRQMWAPDAVFKDGTYYFYFPAKDTAGIFRIGVATGDRPEGPFEPQPQPIQGSFSIDPAVFTDEDGTSYMYFGGIWGGQLQCWTTGEYDPNCQRTDHQEEGQPALMPKVARLSDDMLQFAEPPRDAVIVDEQGRPLLGGDTERRFFEAPWMHKYNGQYYLSYSTGDTHYLVYAVGDSPYGPFTYRGRILEPVQGWTTHHSIVEVDGRWYLFYHDTQLSNETHLRNIKVTELTHRPDGTIETIDPFIR